MAVMDYVLIARNLAKANAPDGAWNDLIETMSYDEGLNNAEYGELYDRIMKIYKEAETCIR